MQVEQFKIKKVESFYILEDRPECKTPQDERIQQVVLPALLVEDSKGKQYLIYENKEEK